ncbi:MAG: phosphatidate cytidylyltransferase, partial [Chloroflexota bacterium]
LALRLTDPRIGFLSWAGNVISALYPSLLAFVAVILAVGPSISDRAFLHDTIDSGRIWLLILVLTVWALDTFAYVAGKYHGRGRFMNHISPNKTWSGVVGGTAAALLVCTLLVWAAGQQPLLGIALGAVIAVAAQAGDLAESMLKRAAGVKDSSNLIPGHGGVLDRVDSFLFAAPAMFIALNWLQGLLRT